MTQTHGEFMAGLLPGSGVWPCAADVDLTMTIDRLIAQDADTAAAWAAVGTWELPPRRESERLQDALRSYERTQPETFAAAMLLVYSAYYSHPDILVIVEQQCGYPARPPQPMGHAVHTIAADPRPSTAGRPPLWREDGTDRGREIHRRQAEDPERIWTEEEIAAWPTS